MSNTITVTKMKPKNQVGKKVNKVINTSLISHQSQQQNQSQQQQQSHILNSQSSLSISRNKHWKYISSYHGPWLQLPLELLESLYVINNENVSTPPLIDPIIFGNLISIRRLVDEAADLSVRAAAGISTTGGGPTRSSMSHTRQHRMRELAVNKLALAYRIDEIATAVVTMQSASAIDEVASKVLKKNPTNLDALYVNFFHEKIPSSRMLSQSTSTDVLDQIISTSPTTPEFYRTRGVVKCFKEEFTGALRDFKMALAHVKHRKRVNNVLLGKKSTLPLHNHHGNDDDECTGTESQLYFLRAACYLQYAISLIDKAIQKVDGVERKEGEGSELRLVAVKKGTASNHGSYSKLEEYRKELLPIMNQVQNLAKRSVRNYTHFLSFYPNSLPPFSPMNDETASKGSTPVTSRDSSPARSFKEKEDNGCCSSSSNGHNDHQPNTKFFERTRKFTEKVTGVSSDNGNSSSTAISTFPKEHHHHHHHHYHHHHHHHHPHNFHGFQQTHTFATYHPLLIEAWYAIAINYVLIGDIHTGAMWHSRTSEMHECIDGYPVFLPARSMAQADYMEVLERIKKSTSLSQHEKLRELIEVVKQKEKEREEKEREWVKHHHHHHRMLLAAAEEEKEVNEGKKFVKIGKRSKNLKQGNNNNNITPVIGIDGQRHHPCCPLAPGNHSSSKEHNNHHVHHHSHNSGSSISASNSSYSNNSNGSSGPRQYPLHTQRADSVMMWLKAIILRQKENNGKASVAANTNGVVKPMMNGTSTKIIDNI